MTSDFTSIGIPETIFNKDFSFDLSKTDGGLGSHGISPSMNVVTGIGNPNRPGIARPHCIPSSGSGTQNSTGAICNMVLDIWLQLQEIQNNTA